MPSASHRTLLAVAAVLLCLTPALAGGCSDLAGSTIEPGSDGGDGGDTAVPPGGDSGGQDTGPTTDAGGMVPWDAAAEASADTGVPPGDAGADGAPGPIAVWNFDEGSGAWAFDSSGHAHTATLFGGATFAPGKHGTGLSPNGTGWAAIPATLPDAGGTDAGGTDAGASDASDGDAGAIDAGDDSAGGSDGAADDAGSADGGADDAGSADADLTEAGAPDATVGDAASPDAGPGDVDAGPFAPLVLDTTSSFSVVCWVKVYSQGVNQWQTAFSRDGQKLSVFTLKLRGDSPVPNGGEKFDFDFPGADDTATGIYTVAQSLTSPTVSAADGGADYWYHLAGVFDRGAPDAGAATSVRIYVNGSLEASVAPAGAILEGVGDTIIGASLFGGRGSSWNGVIDDVSLYDRPLSAGEVAALYTSTR